MKILTLGFVVSLLAFSVLADDSTTPAPAMIGTSEATNFFGKEMVVTGTVAQVSIRPGIVFLNMDKPYPDSPFTLVIFPSATNQFGNLRALKGSTVQVTGLITNYHARAEIVLEKAKQLKVTSPAPAPAPAMIQ